MNTTMIIVAVFGFWFSIWVIWTGWIDRRDPKTPGTNKASRFRVRLSKNQRLAMLAGLVAGIVVWLLSGWLIAVLAGPALAWLIPLLLGSDGTAERIERLDALSEWTRLLASSVSVVGLEQAIVSTQGSIPAPIFDEVTALIARVRTNAISTKTAIRAFADDIDDGDTGDLIAATLIVAADKRGSGLRLVLDSLAESVDEAVRNRRKIEAEREGTRSQTRLLSAIIGLFLAGLFLLTDYMDTYKEGPMQIVLAIFLTGFGGCLLWMRRITAEAPAPRFLGAKANPAAATSTKEATLK